MTSNPLLKLIDSNTQEEIEYVTSTFPSGEDYVKIIDVEKVAKATDLEIQLLSASSVMVMKAILLGDACSKLLDDGCFELTLYAPYLPYGRQDRVCKQGESSSLCKFMQLISTTFHRLKTVEPHNLTKTLLAAKTAGIELVGTSYNNKYMKLAYVSSENNDLKLTLDTTLPRLTRTIVISPDAGAKDRLVTRFGEACVVSFNKKRTRMDDKGTEIVIVPEDDVEERLAKYDYGMVIDDICDGGATFLGLANLIKSLKGDIELDLVITHGIFSKGRKGLEDLLNRYNNIYVADLPTNRAVIESIGYEKLIN